MSFKGFDSAVFVPEVSVAEGLRKNSEEALSRTSTGHGWKLMAGPGKEPHY